MVTQSEIYAFLKENPNKFFTRQQIAEHFKIKSGNNIHNISKLYRAYKEIDRGYRLVKNKNVTTYGYITYKIKGDINVKNKKMYSMSI